MGNVRIIHPHPFTPNDDDSSDPYCTWYTGPEGDGPPCNLPADNARHRVGMPEKRALDLAIFAINTMLHPDASSDADVAALDAEGEEAVAVLALLRSKITG